MSAILAEKVAELGDHGCPETLAHYQRALASLSDVWTGSHSLPCRVDYYETLAHWDFCQHRTRQLFRGKVPCGCHSQFKLNPNHKTQ